VTVRCMFPVATEQGFGTHFNLKTTGFQQLIIHKPIQSVQTNTAVVWPAVSLLKRT
jgi:hypothetical protein